MRRINLNLEDDQIAALVKLPGTTSEHIRAAINDYIEKKKREAFNVSSSPSAKGGQNG